MSMILMWEDNRRFLLEKCYYGLWTRILAEVTVLKLKCLSYKSIVFYNMFLLWLLWCFYQLFGTLILTAPIHCRGYTGEQETYATFLQICSDEEKQTHLDGLSKISTNVHFWLNYSFNDQTAWKIHTGKVYRWTLERDVMMDRLCHHGCQVSVGGAKCVTQHGCVVGWHSLLQNAALLPKLFLWQLPWKLGDSDSP